MPQTARAETRRRVPRMKVVVPSLPRGFVSRPRLLSALGQVRDITATLVCAPAGSGKTVLVADWVRRGGTANTAWVSLDTDDNDDRRFWSAVLAALAECPSVPRESPLRGRAVPGSPSRDLAFLAAVVNALDELPDPVWLVFDDVHELTDPEPLYGLETLLRHRPAGLRLVLVSRYNPPLPLARLSLADQLIEIRAADLRFSMAEARALLDAAGVDLLPDQLRQLVEQTEGWAAGLRLAAGSLGDAEDPGRFLAEFAENDRAVADYLIDEVLSRLPDELREFLRTISVCDEVSAGLACAVSGRVDAGSMLDTLERKTSLLVRTGAKGRWYRLHALVRSSLLAELTRQAPGRAAALHATAAGWFADHGRPVRALDHAARTGNAGHISALLRRQAVSLILCGEHEVLRRTLGVLGDQAVADDSLFALVSAWLRIEEGQPGIADLHLTHADAAWPEHPASDLETLRHLVLSRRAQLCGDPHEMMRTTDVFETAPVTGAPLDAPALLYRGTALSAAGRPGPARDQVRAALDIARERRQDYLAGQCLAVLGSQAAAAGDFPLMTELAREADEAATRGGWERTLAGAAACVLLAYGALLRAEPGECLRQVTRAEGLADADVPPANRSPNLAVAALGGTARFELGEWTAGLRRLREARLSAGEAPLPVGLAALCAVLEHRAAVRLGWGDVAGEVVSWSRNSIPDSGEILLMRARTHLALGRAVSAGKLLRPLFDGSTPPLLVWSVVEASLLESEAALLAGDQARAVRALKKALAKARSLRVRYPLVFAAPQVVELLTAQRGKLGELDRFAAELLAVRRGLQTPPIPAPLTRRERSVLRLLPTLRSFEEIAEDLTVSPNTVKTHVRSIYTKLGVRRRRDAVTVALERGLLEDPYPDSGE